MKRAAGAQLIAVDGIDSGAIVAAARAELGQAGRGGVSRGDASGVFQDLSVADPEAGAPSARTLLLLYAADLAFRVRWHIRPALAEGRVVVAAPYVETAVAVGRAAGLPAGWISNLFKFAPPPARRRYVHAGRSAAPDDGFVEFASARIAGGGDKARRRFITDIAAQLLRADRRRRGATG
jgi:hypothetical protein